LKRNKQEKVKTESNASTWETIARGITHRLIAYRPLVSYDRAAEGKWPQRGAGGDGYGYGLS